MTDNELSIARYRDKAAGYDADLPSDEEPDQWRRHSEDLDGPDFLK